MPTASDRAHLRDDLGGDHDAQHQQGQHQRPRERAADARLQAERVGGQHDDQQADDDGRAQPRQQDRATSPGRPATPAVPGQEFQVRLGDFLAGLDEGGVGLVTVEDGFDGLGGGRAALLGFALVVDEGRPEAGGQERPRGPWPPARRRRRPASARPGRPPAPGSPPPGSAAGSSPSAAAGTRPPCSAAGGGR